MVVILSVLLTMGISALNVQSENIAYSATKNRQQIISEALSGYFAKNGRLPCPDILGAAGNFIGRGDDNRATPENPATACSADTGVLPYIDLGLPRDGVLDGWENYFTYRVTTDATVPLDWARSSPTVIPGKPGKLIVKERNPATNAVLTLVSAPAPANAVYVLVSHGKNGLGATTSQGTVNVAPVAGTDEALNIAGLTADGFIRREVTTTNVPGFGAYDDVVYIGSADKLIAPLIKDGSVRSAEGTTQKALSDMADVVIGQAISAATLPVGAAGTDGWGNGIVYARLYALQITSATPVGTPAFSLTSYGPDGAAGGTDNVVMTVTTDSLKTIFAKAGTLLP